MTEAKDIVKPIVVAKKSINTNKKAYFLLLYIVVITIAAIWFATNSITIEAPVCKDNLVAIKG